MGKVVGLSAYWCFFAVSFLFAQKKKHYYTDFKPTYKQWQRNYIIDKIEYRKDSLVVFFRYYAVSQYTSVELHAPAPQGAYPYCLENTENENEFYEMVDMKKHSYRRLFGTLLSQINRQTKYLFQNAFE